MSEDSIFIVNVEQYLLCSRRKRLPKTCLYCLFFMYISFEDEKKKKFTANANFIYKTITMYMHSPKYILSMVIGALKMQGKQLNTTGYKTLTYKCVLKQLLVHVLPFYLPIKPKIFQK